MLANQLVLKEALTKKWEDQPAVAAQLKRVRETAIVESYLQSVSTAPEGFPTDGELEKAYEANKAAFLVPRQFQVAQIFISLPADADKSAADKANKKVADVQAKLKHPMPILPPSRARTPTIARAQTVAARSAGSQNLR